MIIQVGDKLRYVSDEYLHLYGKVGIVETVFSDESFYVNFGEGPVEFFVEEIQDFVGVP